jgi:hypothetical protein
MSEKMRVGTEKLMKDATQHARAVVSLTVTVTEEEVANKATSCGVIFGELVDEI